MTFKLGEEPHKGKYPGLAAGIPRLPVNLDLDDLHSFHIVGSPGEGKSTLLGRLADACIENGEGVLLIDPKGDLALELAQRTYHQDRLIYVAPGSKDWSLNVLECDDQSKEIVAGTILELFAFLGKYDPSFMTLVGQYLTAATQLAFTDDQPTLMDVLMILLDEGYRKEIVEATRRPDLKLFWAAFNQRTPTDRRYQTDSTKARLWEFILNSATFRFIFHYESNLRLTEWLNQGKLVVINLAEGLDYGDSVRIGNLIVSYLTIQYRLRESGLSRDNRRWRLIIDEFHEFAPRPFARIIRNGRSFNVFPVLAHQDMDQLSDMSEINGAIGHAARLSLRGSSDGAKAISRRRYQGELTLRSPRDTSRREVLLAEWDAPVHGLVEPEVISRPASSWPRYERFVSGKINGSAKPKTKTSGPHPPSRTGQDIPNEHDPAGIPSDGLDRPTRLLDLITGQQDSLLGEAKHPRSTEETLDGPERRQRDVFESSEG